MVRSSSGMGSMSDRDLMFLQASAADAIDTDFS